jgi:hypothetical protein
MVRLDPCGAPSFRSQRRARHGRGVARSGTAPAPAKSPAPVITRESPAIGRRAPNSSVEAVPRNIRALLKNPKLIKPVEVATGLNPADFNANWRNVEGSRMPPPFHRFAGLFCRNQRGAVSLHTREDASSNLACP